MFRIAGLVVLGVLGSALSYKFMGYLGRAFMKTSPKISEKNSYPENLIDVPREKAAADFIPIIKSDKVEISGKSEVVTKTQLIDDISNKADITKKDSDLFLKAFVKVITDELKKKDEFRLDALGTFKIVETPARKARNPNTGESVEIPAQRVARFKPSKSLRESAQQSD